MRTDELVTAIRLAGKFSPLDPDWTDAAIRTEAYNVLLAAFVKPVVEARQGYWLKSSSTSLTSGQAAYRIPPRAVAGVLEKLEVIDPSGNTAKIDNISLRDAAQYENQSGAVPYRYTVQDDSIVVYPTPSSSSYSLRATYYLRPSKLEQEQASTSNGVITAVNQTARQVTVTALPLDRENSSTPLAGGGLVDIVHPNGQFSSPIFGVSAATITGVGPYVITLGGTQDMSGVAVGDYVRFAEQTDWPPLPVEFHETLAEATAIMILTKKGDNEKAQSLAGKVQNDIDRFLALASPRVKENPPILRNRYGVLRQGAGRINARYTS